MGTKSENIDDSIINSLLHSNDLKEIIQRLVQNEVKSSGNHESAIQKLSEIFSRTNSQEQSDNSFTPKKHSSIIAINDLQTDKQYNEQEIVVRCSLASLFRLIDMEGWTKSIYNLITLRFNGSFYSNPFGLLNHEITASSLIKINLDGTILDSGSTILGINKNGWNLHQSIYSNRSDVNCIVQISLPDVVAVSSIKAGLLPVSLEAAKLLDSSSNSLSNGGVKYHCLNFENSEVKFDRLINDLGSSKVLFIRNNSLLICAKTIAEAWVLTKMTVVACQSQIRLIQLIGKDFLKTENNFARSRSLFSDINMLSEDKSLDMELEFEAMMRLLDNAGYRTGHKYSGRQIKRAKQSMTSPKKQLKIVDPISSDGDKCHIDEIQICPMPKENGDMNEENMNESDDGCDETDLAVEREIVQQLCDEIIDNSVRFVEQENALSESHNDNEE